MRFATIFAVLLVLLMAFPALGVQRTVLVEQFTNSGCPGCKAIKDSMSVIYEQMCAEGKIVPILYHTWWPDPDDPFYQFNSWEDSMRVMYYAGVPPWTSYLYVPSFRFDGKYIKDPSDFQTYDQWYDFFRQTVDSLLTISSPIRIKIVNNSLSADSDSVYVSFDVIAEEDASFNMSLYLAVTEWRHRYTFPVGKHDHAFRDFVPDENGYQIAGMNAGDSLHFDWVYYVDPEYRTDRLVTNIFIQRNGTRKVQQAIRQEPTASAGVDVVDVSEPVWLGKNVPNPFTSETTISFSLKYPSEVELSVYTLEGRLIINLIDGYKQAGKHSVTWDGRDRFGNDVASGVYYYRLSTRNTSQVGKMILLR